MKNTYIKNMKVFDGEQVIELVKERVEQGADYIKIMIEYGTVFGKPGIPDVSDGAIETTCKVKYTY